MHVSLILQPDGDLRLGDVLVNCFDGDVQWPYCRVAMAFVKRSGLRHIEELLRGYVEGGGQLEMLIGVDHRGTSREGLELLLATVGDRSRLWVFHNENPSTFHPKVFLFSSDEQALLIIGSGNLTEGGLYTNYEAGTITGLDLSLEQDQRLLQEINAFIDGLLGQGGLSLELSQDSLEQLVEQGYVVSEVQSRDDAAEEGARPRVDTGDEPSAGAGLFARAGVRTAPRRPSPSREQRIREREEPEALPGEINRGGLLWQKVLPSTDAQRQTGNVTGVLRLSQSGFRVNGQLISIAEYFRNNIFGHFEWNVTQANPYQESTHVRVRILVLGEDWGEHQLRVSHQPSRVSGQGNVPTVLHWGDLTQDIRNANVVGHTLRLYGPSEGTAEPYVIEIV